MYVHIYIHMYVCIYVYIYRGREEQLTKTSETWRRRAPLANLHCPTYRLGCPLGAAPRVVGRRLRRHPHRAHRATVGSAGPRCVYQLCTHNNYTYTYAHAHSHMHTHTHLHTHSHTHTRTQTHTHKHTHICTHTYTYTRTHTRTPLF